MIKTVLKIGGIYAGVMYTKMSTAINGVGYVNTLKLPGIMGINQHNVISNKKNQRVFANAPLVTESMMENGEYLGVAVVVIVNTTDLQHWEERKKGHETRRYK